MIVYDQLKTMQFAPVHQTYVARDSMLYALGLNIGVDPLDADALAYAAGTGAYAPPTFAMTLARLGPWMRDPAVGINYALVVVGEVALRLHAPIPIAADVRGDHRVTRVTDKGEGRGALVTVVRELRDEQSGQLLAEFEQLTFCRGDGGFAADGRHDPPAPTSPWDVEGQAPAVTIALPTSPQQALIYRLSGDMNPLHADPELARKGGFERPILHGLATMGMAGHALHEWARKTDGGRLKSIRGRLAAPVFPGEILRLEAWLGTTQTLFRVLNGERREVISKGLVEFHYVG